MRCYKCNSVLSDSDYCLKCGADVSVYKTVVKASNSYYNAGLAKARVRDLTGAITELRPSLSINRRNIKARNLLGLIYFEMGEAAKALSEWVISINLKPDKNVADVYIRKVKSNPNKLEIINQAVKKYNIALAKAKEGGDDVALIQLKKVVASMPHFVKAHLLLALLYMKKNEDERALKLLHKVLKVDRNNTIALKYIDEINHTGAQGDTKVESDDGYRTGKKADKALSGNDVIIPRNSYKEPSNGVFTVVYILLGIIIGVAIVWFLVVPSKLQNTKQESNDLVKKYSEQLSVYSIQITRLTDENAELQKKVENLQQDLAGYEGTDGSMELYGSLVNATGLYLAGKYQESQDVLNGLDVTKLPTDAAKELYTALLEADDKGLNPDTATEAATEAQ